MSENQQKIYKSVCRICHGGCAAHVVVKDEKVVKVRPAPDTPFNLGQFCSKGLATPSMMYHPDRILTPLKRVGERGADQWEEIDWDTALDEIAEKLNVIRQELGPESIALGQGTGRHHYMHLIRFANTLGTPNWYEPGFANCFIPRITVSNHTYGGFVSADLYGDVTPKTMIFWGRNPLVTGPDGELSFAVRKVLDDGAYGIAIDPRRSETAKECKMWLPLRPGTDGALALAMIHTIIYEDIFDKDFVEKWTTGFTELKTHVKQYTPQWAAEISGVSAEQIVSVARRYALHKPSVIEWGVAIEQTPNSLQTVRAIAILRGITGNIDVPGGDILGMNIINSYPLMREALPFETAKKRIGGEQFKFLSGSMALLPSAHVPGVFKAMRTGVPYPIKALLNFGSNPLTTVANSKQVRESLLNLDLLVVADMFKTPTAALADYILPAAFWPEVNQIIEMPFIAQNSVTIQPKILQTGQCRQDEEIMIDLARRLNLPGSEESLNDILNYRLEPLGINMDELKEKFMVFPPHEYRKYEKGGFKTVSGKVELYSSILKIAGYDPLPTYKEPPESPVSKPKTAKKFPYVLITGARSRGFFHSEHRQIDYLRSKRPHPLAQLHPEMALIENIEDGDWIYISSPRGKIKMKAVITEDIKKDVVSIDHGWWFPEKADFGLWESNANVLTSDQPPYDPGFGSYQLRALLCKVEKVDNNEKEISKKMDDKTPSDPISDVMSDRQQNIINIAENLVQANHLFADKVALIFEDQSFTYDELNRASNQIANGLSKLGVERGQRVVLFLPNIPAFISTYFAIQKLGAVAVIVNSALTAREITYITDDSGAKTLITTEALKEHVVEQESPNLEHILITNKTHSLNDLFTETSISFQTQAMQADNPSAILYTSGTTGDPKGAIISHGNILFDAHTTAYLYRMQADDRVLLFAPLSHSFTLSAGLNTCVRMATTMVLHGDFDPENIIHSISEYKITCFYGSTPAYTVLLQQASVAQLKSVRFYISGGTAMPESLAENWLKKFNTEIHISYGLTECSQCCFNDFLKIRRGSVGSAVEGVELKVINKQGKIVKSGEAGELVVKSPKVISGYWNQPEKTDQSIKDGWFYTGDIGKIDSDGYVFITDRIKDMLNVGGQSMYPSEVENILSLHPAIADVAVYGMPVPIMGEQVCAAIVLKPDQNVQQKDIIEYCREQMAEYKIPSSVSFMEALPRAKSGKILKRKLREQAQQLSEQSVSTTSTESLSLEAIEIWVVEWLAKEFNITIESIETDRAFAEYGLTSILTMKLMVEISQWSGEIIDPVVAWHYPTAILLSNYLHDTWRTPSKSALSKIETVSRERDLSLSFLQEELWHSCRSQTKLQFWSRLNVLNISGQLDLKALSTSFNLLAKRHEILRTTFPIKENKPVLNIAASFNVRMQVVDLSFISEQEQLEEVEQLIEQEKQQLLDLINGATWRVKLLRLNEDSHVLIIFIHHLIMDAASIDILYRELFTLYDTELLENPNELTPLEFQFADFSHWQRQRYTTEKLVKQAEYYQQLLNPVPPRLSFINAKTSTIEGDVFPSAFLELNLSSELTAQLENLAQQSGTTLFTTLLTSMLALLHRYTESEDILVAVPMSKRFYSGLESLIGDFSGEIMIRTAIGQQVTFTDLLNQVHQAVQSAITNQELTYQQVCTALGKALENISTPHQVMLNFIPELAQEIQAEGIIATCSIEKTVRNKMFLDLALRIWQESNEDGDILKGGFRYRTDLFEESSIVQMIDDFKVLIEAVISHSERPIKDIKLSI